MYANMHVQLTVIADDEGNGGSESVEHTLASRGERSGLDGVLHFYTYHDGWTGIFRDAKKLS